VDDLFRYDGKRVLVVGCYSGMGESTVRILQSLGAEVHGIDYKQPANELASFTECDLRDKNQIDLALGGLEGPFDSLFYCAGLPQTRPPLEVMSVNLIAMREIVNGVVPLLAPGGSVAIISSNAGLQFTEHMPVIFELLATNGFDEAYSWCEQHLDVVSDGYMFSKEAIIVFTMVKAMELVGQGIRVNCTSPGPTATPMMPEFEKAVGEDLMKSYPRPIGRDATPAEQGWPLVFLNSDAASYITGLNLVVDGGFLAGVMTGAIDMTAFMEEGTRRLAEQRGAS
jgi:NAD(P)-dependent dehydrogenase (short-subunit alcohol dehydrogenase family)